MRKRGLCLTWFAANLALATPAHSASSPARSATEVSATKLPAVREEHGMPSQANSALYYIDSRLHHLEQEATLGVEALKRAIAEDPQSDYLQGELARQLAAGQDFEEAMKANEKALSLNPKSPDLYLLKGKLYSAKKESKQAIQTYRICLRLDPKLEECELMIAREHLLQNQDDLAKQSLQKILSKNPNSEDALFYLATLYSSYENTEAEAVKLYERILTNSPENLKSLIALSQIHLDRGDLEKALDLLLRLEALTTVDFPTQLRIGLIYYELKNYPKAIDRFTRLLQVEPNNDRLRYYLGILEAQNQHPERALEHFAKVPPSSDYFKDAVIRTALLQEKRGKSPLAVRAVKEALERQPETSEFYELLTSLYLKKNQKKEALRVLDQAREKFPQSEKLIFTQATLLDKLGEHEKSAEQMQSLIKQNPNHALALNYLAFSYVERGERLTEALQMLQRADQLKPEDPYITDSLGWAYFKLGQLDKALEFLKKAERLKPQETSILEHLGEVYAKQGEREKSQHYFQAALDAAEKQSNPNREELQRLRLRLRRDS